MKSKISDLLSKRLKQRKLDIKSRETNKAMLWAMMTPVNHKPKKDNQQNLLLLLILQTAVIILLALN